MPILRLHAAYICGRPAVRVFVMAEIGRRAVGAYTDAQGCAQLAVPEDCLVELEFDGCACDALVAVGHVNRRFFARLGSPLVSLMDVSSAGDCMPLARQRAPIEWHDCDLPRNEVVVDARFGGAGGLELAPAAVTRAERRAVLARTARRP